MRGEGGGSLAGGTLALQAVGWRGVMEGMDFSRSDVVQVVEGGFEGTQWSGWVSSMKRWAAAVSLRESWEEGQSGHVAKPTVRKQRTSVPGGYGKAFLLNQMATASDHEPKSEPCGKFGQWEGKGSNYDSEMKSPSFPPFPATLLIPVWKSGIFFLSFSQ